MEMSYLEGETHIELIFWREGRAAACVRDEWVLGAMRLRNRRASRDVLEVAERAHASRAIFCWV